MFCRNISPTNRWNATLIKKPDYIFGRANDFSVMDGVLGLASGIILGVGLTLGVIRVRGWLGRSEAGRLRAENRSLKRRLAEKDRHIGRMIAETERLAERLGELKAGDEVGTRALE
jgi:hypothetical protein